MSQVIFLINGHDGLQFISSVLSHLFRPQKQDKWLHFDEKYMYIEKVLKKV